MSLITGDYLPKKESILTKYHTQANMLKSSVQEQPVKKYNKAISNYSQRHQMLSKIDSFYDAQFNQDGSNDCHDFDEFDIDVDIIKLEPELYERNTLDSESRNNNQDGSNGHRINGDRVKSHIEFDFDVILNYDCFKLQ